MFTDLNPNIQGRVSIRVCGRVLVFTNSKLVEYLTHDQEMTFPLFVTGGFAEGFGTTFVIEMDGFLVFDRDAFVKHIQTDEYQRTEIDHCKFLLLAPSASSGGTGGSLEGTPYVPATPAPNPTGTGGTTTSILLTSAATTALRYPVDGYSHQTLTFSDGSSGKYRAADVNGQPQPVPQPGMLKSSVLSVWSLYNDQADEYMVFLSNVTEIRPAGGAPGSPEWNSRYALRIGLTKLTVINGEDTFSSYGYYEYEFINDKLTPYADQLHAIGFPAGPLDGSVPYSFTYYQSAAALSIGTLKVAP